MSKAIFLVDDNPVIKAAFEKLHKDKEETDKLFDEIKERMHAERKGCWQTVEEVLLELGKIESDDVLMRYKDGCIFIVDDEDDFGCEPFKTALKKMFAED